MYTNICLLNRCYDDARCFFPFTRHLIVMYTPPLPRILVVAFLCSDFTQYTHICLALYWTHWWSFRARVQQYWRCCCCSCCFCFCFCCCCCPRCCSCGLAASVGSLDNWRYCFCFCSWYIAACCCLKWQFAIALLFDPMNLMWILCTAFFMVLNGAG